MYVLLQWRVYLKTVPEFAKVKRAIKSSLFHHEFLI